MLENFTPAFRNPLVVVSFTAIEEYLYWIFAFRSLKHNLRSQEIREQEFRIQQTGKYCGESKNLVLNNNNSRLTNSWRVKWD